MAADIFLYGFNNYLTHGTALPLGNLLKPFPKTLSVSWVIERFPRQNPSLNV